MLNAFTDGVTPVEMTASGQTLKVNAKLLVRAVVNSEGNSYFDHVGNLERAANNLTAEVNLVTARMDSAGL